MGLFAKNLTSSDDAVTITSKKMQKPEVVVAFGSSIFTYVDCVEFVVFSEITCCGVDNFVSGIRPNDLIRYCSTCILIVINFMFLYDMFLRPF